MWQFLAAQAVGNTLQGLAQRKSLKRQNQLTDLENLIDKANTDASNVVRKANNELKGAISSLNRFRQSIQTSKNLIASGEAETAVRTNLIRATEDLSRGNIESRLDTAFQMGSLAAAVSAAGVGGSSRDVISSTIKMTHGRREAELQRHSEQMTYDALLAVTNLQADAYNQVPGDLFLDALDFQVDHHIPATKRKVPSVLSTLVRAGLTSAAENPQLTQQAVADFRSTGGNSQAQPYGAGSGFAQQISLKV